METSKKSPPDGDDRESRGIGKTRMIRRTVTAILVIIRAIQFLDRVRNWFE